MFQNNINKILKVIITDRFDEEHYEVNFASKHVGVLDLIFKVKLRNFSVFGYMLRPCYKIIRHNYFSLAYVCTLIN